jgi:hypothetical protein
MDASALPPNQRPAPSLAELRAQLLAAEACYPALRRELRGALAGVERALGVATAPDDHDARRRGGLR